MKNDPRTRNILAAALVMVAAMALLLVFVHWAFNTHAPGAGGVNVEFEIDRGMSLSRIAAKLASERLVPSAASFKWAARLHGAERLLQPGIFLLPTGATNSQIIRYLLKPGVQTRDVTIPEGLTTARIAGILHRELDIDSTKFVRLCEDSLFAASLGVPADRLEGYLFPDTYNFYRETTARSAVERMVGAFFKHFTDTLRAEAEGVGLTLHEAVTLASIIQGEMMVASEAPLISAVYHNRLRRGMLLGADPTIQYIIRDGPRRLLHDDLAIESPYNTYRHRGLPPGPINSPGMDALHAAVRPVDADYLYFVAKGDGTHYFNTTAAGHERDKLKLQKLRRRVARLKQR